MERTTVAFRPVNPRNAVLEAVVLVQFNRPIFEPETRALRALHPRLAHDLPRLDELHVVNVAFGPGLPPVPPGVPVMMAAFKKDGTLETRLLLQQQVLAVNFLLYTRWDELWPKALGWLRSALDALQDAASSTGLPPLQIVMIGHQMINVFVWEGAGEAVTVKHLFAQKPVRLPDAAWEATGQSWLAVHSTNEQRDFERQRAAFVDSLGFDLSDDPSTGWRLRLEHTMETRLTQPVNPSEITLEHAGAKGPLLETAVNDLHECSRRTLRKLLPSKMLNRIGMSAS